MLKQLLIILLIGGFTREALAQTPAPTVPNTPKPKIADGHKRFEDFPPEKEKLFLDSVFKDQVLISVDGVKRVFSDKDDLEAWEGNSPQLLTQIPKAVLRFRKPAPTDKPEANDSIYDITVEFHQNQILVKHSMPQNPKLAPGWKIPLGADQQFKFFMAGLRDTGMTVLAPQVNLNGQNVRALMLCPRNILTAKGRRGKDIAFVESAYRFSRGLFTANAYAKAKTVSGGGIGVARGHILTSPNISRAHEYQDQAYMKDPAIDLEYAQVAGESLNESNVDGNITAGIEAQIELHRPSGYKRVSTSREMLWVKEFSLRKDQAWFIRRKNDDVRVAPGNCYMLFKERSVEHRFLKEPLALPERLH